MTTVYKPLHTHHNNSVPISADIHSLYWWECLAGRRGSRPWGKVLYGHTWLETPDPVRSPKLSNHRRVQYSGGGPPGKRTYCTAHKQPLFETILVLVPRRARTRSGQTLGLHLALGLVCAFLTRDFLSLHVSAEFLSRQTSCLAGRRGSRPWGNVTNNKWKPTCALAIDFGQGLPSRGGPDRFR